ncbi:hypothetical protein ABIB51_003793 [Arthrobacter sp. UYCu712]
MVARGDVVGGEEAERLEAERHAAPAAAPDRSTESLPAPNYDELTRVPG